MRQAYRKSAQRRGFTLIELMVVVVLLAIMSAMIIPEMRGTYEDQLLRSTGRKLVSACNLAYSQAVTLSQLHRVRLDRKSGRYTLERAAREGEESGAFILVREVSGSEGELDTRISIEIRKPNEDPSGALDPETSPVPTGEPQSQARGEALTFYADGTADAREIILRDREGFQLALRINPTTARVQVVELERQ